MARQDGTVTWYEVLGVSRDAPAGDIRRAYVAAARRHHPDRHALADPRTQATAAARMRDANAAWAVLGDAARRRDYDATLRRQEAPPPRPAPPRDTSRPPGAGGADRAGAADPDDPWLTHGLTDADLDATPFGGLSLPRWLAVTPVLGFAAGLGFLIVGLMIGLGAVAGFGLVLLAVSGMLFLAAPLVALALSRGRDRRSRRR
jgi:hypothetical protein